jgi:hypothetical protein
MIECLTASQIDSLRTTIEYLWGKSYSKQMFNKSTLLTLMRERLDLRQDDIRLGRTENQAEIKTLLKQMAQEGKLAKEQLEEVLARMEGLNRQQKE